ncbi:HD domain-containing phosphohydrolase [Thaumasiovibrio subtropicus]|uniref:HD domain-containing phosphohydrolase n=1 Tax=Thaumasiovibrio subtropicus TaxID=1891207 RepID=UPI000B35F9BF|nr:HD domain-containing phosphohydrolase [Thaumasiovibrio subtropicus]
MDKMLNSAFSTLKQQRFPLQIHIATIMILVLCLSGLSVATFNYVKTSRIVESNQHVLFETVTEKIQVETQALLNGALSATAALGAFAPSIEEIMRQEHRWLTYFQAVLEKHDALTAMYMGDGAGNFYLVRALNDDEERAQVAAPPEAALMVNTVNQGTGEIRFFSKVREQLATPPRPYPYDPRERTWYRMARSEQGVIVTPPYRFFTGKDIGFTLAQTSVDKHQVVGVDIALSRLSAQLEGQVFSPNTEVLLFGPRQYLLAHSDPQMLLNEAGDGLQRLSESSHPVIRDLAGVTEEGVRHVQQEGVSWRTDLKTLHLGIADVSLAIVTPTDELLSEAKASRDATILISFFIIVLSIPVALWVSGFISRPLNALKRQSEAIMGFDFDRASRVNSNVLEVYQLSHTTHQLQQTIEQFANVSAMVGKEDNFQRLIGLYLEELILISKKPAAAIYLKEDDKMTVVASRGSWLKMPACIDDVEHPLQAALASLTRVAQGPFTVEGESYSYLACPLMNKEGERVGLMVFHDASGVEVNPQQLSFLEALSGVITVAIENRQLVEHQKALMHAFIRLIAKAIDAKSPYTGKHCERVPALTKMLAQSAQRQRGGKFEDFNLNETQWEELFVASWLHDCGKVTTPEYIVDKATKLETIYDRIHEIRMRFEVLKRDAEVAYWQALANGKPVSYLDLKQRWAEYDEQFAFVAKCNVGGEFMSDADIARLEDIGKQTWTRTLNDRLGVGHLALQRYTAPAPELPTQEPLLANKPEHCITHNSEVDQSRYARFNLTPLALMQNSGELYNLSIRRGTLNNEERHKINDHIVQTILMLEELPFPPHLAAVPDIAGGHHEKMDGTGYPRGLRGEQMSLTARMMAIADVFEALTASDRPYKKGKTLTEALRIMYFMVEEEHLDKDLFRLFLEEGIYQQYAEQYMKKSQIDTVDITEFLPSTTQPAATI